MISIIILSYRKTFLEKLLFSIEHTIGIANEIIIMDNEDGRYSICSAYNEGLSRSNYPYLCFVHEDVIFKTQNWGSILVNKMQKNPAWGLVGVMGAQFKSKFPTGWYNPVNACRYLVGNIFQGDNSESSVGFMDYSPKGAIEENAVCIDGVFMFSKKDVFSNCRFDEQMLDGYHGYDLDISLQVFSKGYQVIVDKDIHLFHYSTGSPDAQWERYNNLISTKWRHFLPVSTKHPKNIVHLAFREFETIHIHDKSVYIKKVLFAPFRLLKTLFQTL